MIEGYELKKFHEFKYGHGDSRTFHADLWRNGRNMGTVENDGHGGCNMYYFTNRKDEGDFYKLGKEYGEKRHQGIGDSDSLIEDLINGLEAEKFKKKCAKKGLNTVIECKQGKRVIPPKGYIKHEIIFWDKTWMIALRNESQIDSYVKKEKVDEWEIL